MSISDRVLEIATEHCGFPVTRETPLRSSGLDSVGILDLIYELEAEFDIEIDDAIPDNFGTMCEVVTARTRYSP